MSRGIHPGIQPTLYRPTVEPTCELWWDPAHAPYKGTVIDRAVDPWVLTTIPNPGGYGGTTGSVGAARPPLAHLESNGVSRRVAAFDNVGDYHFSSLAAAAWAAAHQTWTWGFALRPTSADAVDVILSTCVTSAQVGMIVYYDGVNERITIVISNGGGGAFWFSANTPNNSVPLNEVSMVVVRWSQAFGYDVRVNGVSVVNGALPGAPPAGNPNNTLWIGAYSTPANYFGGNQNEITGFSSVLSAAAGSAVEALERYLSRKHQTNAVALQKAPTFWFRGDLRPQPDVGSDVDVEFWFDHAGNAHRAHQTTAADMGDLDRVDALFDDKASIETDGTSDDMAVSAGIGWPAGVDHTVIAAIEEQDVGPNQFLFDTTTTRIAFCPVLGAQVALFDGAARNLGDPVLGPQVLEWHANDTAGRVDGYRAGVLIGSAAYVGVALGGVTGIFADRTGVGAWFDGRTTELWGRDSLLTGVDLWEYREELFGRYPQVWGIVPGGEAWWDPLTEANVTMDGANRVSAVADSNERGNTETQGTAADQPLWVADAGDGSAALRFDASNTEYVDANVTANATAGTIWGWFKKSTVATSRVPIGSRDAAGNRCSIAALDGGNWTAGIGATAVLNSGVAVVADTWVFAALTWDGTNEYIYVNDEFVTQAVGETASTRALTVGVSDVNGVLTYYWDGDIGEHGVFNRALDPYEIARLRRQTQRGGNRDTWIAAIINDHEAWYNPNWGEVVTRIAGDRVTQVDDGHATVGSAAQNNETQGVAADRPIWVADAGSADGLPALRFVAAGTEHLITGVVPNATEGTIYGWFKKNAIAGTQIVMGSADAVPDRCDIWAENNANWRASIGGSHLNSGVAVAAATWTFVALTWDGTNEVIDVDGTRVSQAVGETASTRATTVGCWDNNGALSFYWDGDIGEHGIVNRALSATEIARLRAMTLRT